MKKMILLLGVFVLTSFLMGQVEGCAISNRSGNSGGGVPQPGAAGNSSPQSGARAF